MSKEGIYICAEVGVNWRGDRDLLYSWVDTLFKDKKVDAVKVQLFNEETIKDYPDDLKKKLRPMILDSDDIWHLNRMAQANERDLVVTPMYLECIDWLKDIPIGGLKIRAKDWWKPKFISIQRDFNCPMYVSVPHINGERQWDDVPKEVGVMTAFSMARGNNRYRIYCIPVYPPFKSQLHLSMMFEGAYDGCSLHSTDWYDHYAAAVINITHQYFRNTLRRCYIEVHTLPDDLVAGEVTYIDQRVSVPMHDLYLLTRACEEFEEAIG